MNELKLLLIAILLYGTSVLANLPSGDDKLDSDVVKIKQNVGLLNGMTPNLNVNARLALTNLSTAEQTLVDLGSLYNALQGTQVVAPHSLTTLTCSRAMCFADDQ